MIAKKIEIKQQPNNAPPVDNYRALALYIADANHEGEKTLYAWHEAFQAEDYASGIIEAAATQEMNTRTGKEKTYHLLISFRPEDEAKLTPEIFHEIEKELAKSLGFEEHQRHCGVHKNTDNLHLHIAYNMIHPEKFTRHEPFRDFYKLSEACRKLEQKYGLALDKGAEPDIKKDSKTNARAQALEAHSGQESLDSYIKRHKYDIISTLEGSKNWAELHQVFLKYGLELKPSANGLTIKDRHGKHHAKASAVDRGLSKGHLEKRFGLFQAADKNLLENVVEVEKYEAKPIQKEAERGQLFEQYKRETEQRKKAIDKIKQDENRLMTPIKNKWNEYRKRLEKTPMMHSHRQNLLQKSKLNEEEERAKIRAVFDAKCEEIKKNMPGNSWVKFLRHQAGNGNETALAILRSKKEVISPEKEQSGYLNKKTAIENIRQNSRDEQRKILSLSGVQEKNRKALIAITKMRQLAEEEKAKGGGSIFAGLKHSIDSKGTVIFYLATGGTIRDNGKELHFSAHDKNAQEAAKKFAQMKWGKEVEQQGNIVSVKARQRKNQLLVR